MNQYASTCASIVCLKTINLNFLHSCNKLPKTSNNKKKEAIDHRNLKNVHHSHMETITLYKVNK